MREASYQFDPSSAAVVPARVDSWLCSQIAAISRARIQKLTAQGMVTINAKPVKASHRLRTGDCVRVRFVEQDLELNSRLRPSKVDLDIVYEDEAIVVINKAPGLVMHPGAATFATTLVEGLAYHLGGEEYLASTHDLRPGIVHRLDKDTSGLVVCAKDTVSHDFLARQFANKTNERSYLALLDGVVSESLTVENYIYRDPKYRQRFKCLDSDDFARLCSARGEAKTLPKYRWSKSEFQSLKIFGERISLVQVNLYTGRTHQIRAHAKFLGCPVLGDPVYGTSKELPKLFNPSLRREIRAIKRQLLHAATLGIVHPRSKEYMSFSVPPPQDFQAIHARLSEFDSGEPC